MSQNTGNANNANIGPLASFICRVSGALWKAFKNRTTDEMLSMSEDEIINALRKGFAKQTDPADFPVWRTITIGNQTKKFLRKKLKDGNFYVCNWADEILGKRECAISKSETELDLVVVSVADLGYKNGATTKEIYDRAEELGLELCPAEVGPQLRLRYIDQPKGEWLRVAMKPIKDSDGALRIFIVSRDSDGDRSVHVYYGEPGCGWDSLHRFVFVRRKQSV